MKLSDRRNATTGKPASSQILDQYLLCTVVIGTGGQRGSCELFERMQDRKISKQIGSKRLRTVVCTGLTLLAKCDLAEIAHLIYDSVLAHGYLTKASLNKGRSTTTTQLTLAFVAVNI